VEILDAISTTWPIFIGVVGLVIVLAKMHGDIQIMKEKIRTLFELWNKR
tara:strand:+ start:72 stop:218 length:147 start_codon:yes stop_codon:yes gene_type:complete